MLPDRARAAAEEYARARAVLRTAQLRYTEARVPLDPVDGLPPPWTAEQHAAVHDLHRALQAFVIARSAWIAAPKA